MLALGKAANLGLVATSPKQDINITIGNASSLVDLLTMKTKKTRRDENFGQVKSKYRLAMCDSPNVFMKNTITYKMVFASISPGGICSMFLIFVQCAAWKNVSCERRRDFNQIATDETSVMAL